MRGFRKRIGRTAELSFRYDKEILPREEAFPAVPTVVQLSAEDEPKETANWHAEVLSFLHALRDSGQLSDWNQVAFLFRSVKNHRVVALARYLETHGVPVYSPRSNMFFDREEIRLMIGALIFLFPQFSKVRQWAKGVSLPIWDYYDQACFKVFTDELRKRENSATTGMGPAARETTCSLDPYGRLRVLGPLLSAASVPHLLAIPGRRGDAGCRQGPSCTQPRDILQSADQVRISSLYVTVLNPKFIERDIRNLFNQFFPIPQRTAGSASTRMRLNTCRKGCVSFLTIHQSKGLEFPVVVCGSLEAVPRKQHTALDEILEIQWLPVQAALRATGPYQALRFPAALLHGVLAGAKPAGIGRAETRG